MILRVSTLLALLLPVVTASYWNRRHQEVAHRARGDVDIHKRQGSFASARFTYYAVGLGACGETNGPNDFIVALNVGQYGSGYPGPQCFKSITIQFGGKTAQATIMDECMGCPWGGLDFSEGLFSFFSPLSVGVLYGTWWFNDDGGQTTSWAPPTTTWEPPTTISTPDYTPPSPSTSSTADYTPPPTTSSTPAYTPPPATSTSSIPTISSSSPAYSIDFSTGLVSGAAVPTGGLVPVPDTSNPENILVINNILLEFGIALLTAEKHE